ncbi:MAG: PfkB family carbohydrate kinase [Kiloniellaceae bacterium]
MTGARLLHMGGAVVDYLYRIAELPPRGGESVATRHARLPGGGINQMAAARRSGMAVAYGGGHGTGPDGDLLRAAFAEFGIAIIQAANPDVDSGNCVVMTDDAGERSFVSWPGAEAQLDDAVLSTLQPWVDDWVVVSGYTLSYPSSRDVLAQWIAGLPPSQRVVFDPAPVVASIPPALRDSVLARTTWVSANLDEARVLTGEDDPARQADVLLGRLCPSATGVVLRAGATGCYLQERGKPQVLAPAFPVEAVDTNGAGDTHLGVFLACLAQGEEPQGAVLRANAAAAIAVTRFGGACAPTAQEIDSFLADRQNETNNKKIRNA